MQEKPAEGSAHIEAAVGWSGQWTWGSEPLMTCAFLAVRWVPGLDTSLEKDFKASMMK